MWPKRCSIGRRATFNRELLAVSFQLLAFVPNKLIVKNMYIQSFKQLIVWQRSIELVKEIYKVSREFPKYELYGLVSQMRRAAVSIPSNIAEGRKRKTRKDFLHFLRMSDGSAAEVETLIIITKDLYPNIDFLRAESLLEEIQKMLITMIKKLEGSKS